MEIGRSRAQLSFSLGNANFSQSVVSPLSPARCLLSMEASHLHTTESQAGTVSSPHEPISFITKEHNFWKSPRRLFRSLELGSIFTPRTIIV